eukprot:1342365-Rhodomonas_salina.1
MPAQCTRAERLLFDKDQCLNQLQLPLLQRIQAIEEALVGHAQPGGSVATRLETINSMLGVKDA